MPPAHQSADQQRSPSDYWLPLSIITLALILFAAPFIALYFYSVPALDDFCKATLSFNCVPQKSVLQVTWMYYTQWTPRWLTTLLQGFVMSHVNLVSAYGWLLLCVMLSNLTALWYFFRTFFRLSNGNSLLCASIFYAAWVASLPNPEEEIYWLTGSMEYYLSVSALIVLVCLLHKFRSSFWRYLVIVVFSIAVPAQHEIAGTFLCAALLAGAVHSTVRKMPALHWYVSFALAAFSQIVLLSAPGNRIRAAQEHRHLWDLAHLPKWGAHALYHGLDWLISPAILLAACCIFLIVQRERQRTEDGAPSKWLSLAGLSGMLVLLCEYCLVETASGIWSPERVTAWLTMIFSLCFVCVVLTGMPELYRIQFSLTTRAGVYVLFSVSLLGCSNFRSAIEDLRGPAPAWHNLALSQLGQKTGAVEFQLPGHYPKLAMHQQLAPDSGCWVNRCLANFLHASSVVGKNSSEECPH